MTQTGLHHVTALAGPARRNLDFYTRVLGLRLVKKTVNFDDPGTYHLYFGDGTGRPGSILTFFPFEQAAPGRVGLGETRETAFLIPRASLGWWVQRLVEAGIPHEAPVPVFGEPTLRLRDPDGTLLALVGGDGTDPADAAAGWTGTVPAEHAIRGLHGVTLLLAAAEPTAAILTDVLGLRETGREGMATRLTGSSPLGAAVTLHAVGDFLRGRPGAGSVHHVAFRAADDAAQAAMAARLAREHGLDVSEQRDRQYFRSVYFREPGGVLFEIATDAPGFGIDEPVETLGRALRLPPRFEAHRATIEGALPPLD